MVKPFPPIATQSEKKGDDDYNPAIRLFGRRFFGDQTAPELLIEFLLVATSLKKIGSSIIEANTLFPSCEQLRTWPAYVKLEYAPKARLNLKLFAFLGASKLDTRHESHRLHYRELIRSMTQPEKLSVSGTMDATEVLKTLENLFLGFQSVGGQRTWCAQAFLPIAPSLIAGESIWQQTKATGVTDWDTALPFFTHTQRLFLARGGELLYLQLCNALRQDQSTVQTWLKETGIGWSPLEGNPTDLLPALERALATSLTACPETVSRLAEFLDTCIEAETAEHTDFVGRESKVPRFAECGWCPEEGWPEGILFAIELLRLCAAVVDPIERLELIEIACTMQLLRSLCAQGARYTTRSDDAKSGAGALSYVWAISDPAGQHTAVKQVSRRNVNAVQRMIYDAVRHPSIRDSSGVRRNDSAAAAVYKEADSRYGHKLFLTVAKRIGLVVPKRGAGARFVLNESLLRFLVATTIRPGGLRVTYDTFKKLIFAHFGIAVDDDTIGRSCLWSGTSRLTTLGGNADAWVVEMLDAAGMLIRLSDSCSLVTNPFDGGGQSA